MCIIYSKTECNLGAILVLLIIYLDSRKVYKNKFENAF